MQLEPSLAAQRGRSASPSRLVLRRWFALGTLALALATGAWTLAACRSEGDGGEPASQATAKISCDGGAVCLSGRFLGTLSGDTGDGGLSASGSTSTWLHVRVTEDNNEVNGRPLRLRAQLTAPPSGAFDLRAYFDESRNDDAGLDCVHLVASSVAADGGASLELTWGDPKDKTANGADDGRTVAIEVRNTSGVCAATAPWRVDLRGNP